ncbi:hypothetical protein GIB67_028242 [Kingdonia uniflora]|uniref:Uncharacterized protein n=1 Tax=Kingdonia uniflora TaxID=39325 RepID=A0A7J7KZ66_9MAGN|nr:hypothetical protein GIB67_028242 [Kingdonia uniflora]
MCVGSFSGIVSLRPLPVSVYRSPEIFYKLWNDIQFDNAFGIEYEEVKENSYYTQETDFGSPISGSSSPTGYLIVQANCGLNQQRSSVYLQCGGSSRAIERSTCNPTLQFPQCLERPKEESTTIEAAENP